MIRFAAWRGWHRWNWLLALLALNVVAAEPPAVLLAETWRGGVDVTRYLVSEKFDGVRG